MHNTMEQHGLTAKEMEYLSDSMKNEELLAKLCVQGAGEARDAQLRQTLAQMAQERLHVFNHLLNTLQQQTTLTH